MCLRHYIKLIWESPTTEDKISTVIYAPFIQNSNQMTSRLTITTSFPRVFCQLMWFSRQRPSFSAHGAAPMTKTDLIFRAFSSRFVDFAVQFCFRCKFYSARSDARDARVRMVSGTIFLDQSQFFATHSYQSNCASSLMGKSNTRVERQYKMADPGKT